jgi:hypothetical protein
MEEKSDIKPGFWLTKFYIDSQRYINFDYIPRKYNVDNLINQAVQ